MVASEEDPESDVSNNERAARVGFAQGRVVWFGGADNWQKDWWFYLQNEHTLVSMWRGHALHPFERFDRVVYFLCVLCFSMFMSAYVQAMHPMSESMVVYGVWLVFSSALLIAYDYALRFLATSPCMQPGGSLHDSCWLCRDCCVDCGRQGLYTCAAGSTGFLIGGVVIASTSDDVVPGLFFITFFSMKILSYLGEIVAHAYYFYVAREKQRTYWMDGDSGGPYPFGPGLPDPLFILETRHDGDFRKWPDRANAQGQNPMRRTASDDKPSDDREQRKADRDRIERQIEMLRRARDQVRSEKDNSVLETLGSRV